MKDRSQSGLGIGLTLVREVMRLHDGNVQAYSEGLGKGSEFVLTIPVTEGELLPKKDNGIKFNVSRNILVVDDVLDAANSMASILKFAGHRVWVANSGPVALRMIDQIKPEYILMDIGMPDMNGYEVARTIREKFGPEIVLIAVTGYERSRV